MTLKLQAVAGAMGARWEGPPETVTGWSVDTRTQNPGDVYFALRGPVHDGHDFVAASIEKRASAVVVEWGRPPGLPTNLLCVPDTLVALRELAAWARRQWGGRVVAVTGSAGKTTTKDAI